ncbi:MAG TPA: MarR family transcriptional regulator [Rhizomicrobium sp.]|jgi:DNA-binding MarR family transcriptional regulator|nr:MarR family transcriptional regulator [Rhizomicrobium sp.]
MHVLPPSARAKCHCGALRIAAKRVTAFYDGCLSPSGLTIAQFGLLNLIAATGGGSVNALAARAGLDRTSASRSLRPLEKSGFVRIERSARDGRRRDITLTGAGKKALAKAETLWHLAQQRFEDANGAMFSQSLRASLRNLNLESPTA